MGGSHLSLLHRSIHLNFTRCSKIAQSLRMGARGEASPWSKCVYSRAKDPMHDVNPGDTNCQLYFLKLPKWQNMFI